MRDEISCEEVFEASARERAELNAWCDELNEDSIKAQDALWEQRCEHEISENNA
jgi:hypothetical protein